MRVLVVVHGFPPSSSGGSEIHAHAMAHSLHRRFGDEVVVFTREQDATRPDYDVRIDTQEGVRVVWVNNMFRSIRSFAETYRSDAIGRIADDVIEDFRPNVALIHHLTCLSTTIVTSLAARGIPSILTLHDFWLMCHRGQLLDTEYQVCEGPARGCGPCFGAAGHAGPVGFAGAAALRRLEDVMPSARHLRAAAARALTMLAPPLAGASESDMRLAHMRDVCARVTHFLAPSAHIRDRFVAFGIDRRRISLSPYGVDLEPFTGVAHTAPRTAASGTRLGFMGSLMVSKAPHLLIEAAERLPAGSVSVDLYGEYTPYHGDDAYRARLAPLLDRPYVRTHGPVPHAHIPEALASMDALVVPSIWPENSPLVIHEALRAGVPVVASRIGGIAELVTHEQNGLLFEPGSVPALAAALRRVIDEPGLLTSLRAATPAIRRLDDEVAEVRALATQLRRQADETRRPRLAAIVLNFGTPDQTYLAVSSLLASARPVDDIIVIDNDDTDDARRVLAPVLHRVVYERMPRNLGFSGGMNAGIVAALARGADRVLLVNSDVVVPPDCVERLERSLAAAEQGGIAGPIVAARSHPDRAASLGLSYVPETGRMRHLGVGSAVRDAISRSDRPVDAVSGCLMLVTRPVIDAIGLLDDAYFFSFEDLDYCLRAREAGFATVLSSGAVAYHEGGQSIGAESTRRLYFATRNHLRLAGRPFTQAARNRPILRAATILALNIAHAIRSKGAALPLRLLAVARGARDYASGRFGPDTSG